MDGVLVAGHWDWSYGWLLQGTKMGIHLAWRQDLGGTVWDNVSIQSMAFHQ